MVAPVILARGNRLFRELDGQVKLSLLSTRAFGNGNVLLVYAPA